MICTFFLTQYKYVPSFSHIINMYPPFLPLTLIQTEKNPQPPWHKPMQRPQWWGLPTMTKVKWCGRSVGMTKRGQCIISTMRRERPHGYRQKRRNKSSQTCQDRLNKSSSIQLYQEKKTNHIKKEETFECCLSQIYQGLVLLVPQ